MNIKPIRTDEDYDKALSRIEQLMDAVTQQDIDELDILGTLVDAYESEHFPIPAPGPVAAIKYRMEQMGLSRTDLAPILGAKSRVIDILSGRRSLTVAMIQRLHTKLDIPYSALLEGWRRTPKRKATPRSHAGRKKLKQS